MLLLFSNKNNGYKFEAVSTIFVSCGPTFAIDLQAISVISDNAGFIIYRQENIPVFESENTIFAETAVEIGIELISESTINSQCFFDELGEKTFNSVSYIDALISTFSTDNSSKKYELVITGAADGIDDITLPMSSFNSRRRNDEPTYLSVVIPTVDYIDDIVLRQNGTMKVLISLEQNGEIIMRNRIIETSIDDVDYNHGPRNQSITLIGYATESFSAKTINITGGVVYKSSRSGKLRYRLAADVLFVNPGDTLIFGDDTVEIKTISYAISVGSKTIEFEAA